jgi:hypothetical protein
MPCIPNWKPCYPKLPNFEYVRDIWLARKLVGVIRVGRLADLFALDSRWLSSTRANGSETWILGGCEQDHRCFDI